MIETDAQRDSDVIRIRQIERLIVEIRAVHASANYACGRGWIEPDDVRQVDADKGPLADAIANLQHTADQLAREVADWEDFKNYGERALNEAMG